MCKGSGGREWTWKATKCNELIADDDGKLRATGRSRDVKVLSAHKDKMCRTNEWRHAARMAHAHRQAKDSPQHNGIATCIASNKFVRMTCHAMQRRNVDGSAA